MQFHVNVAKGLPPCTEQIKVTELLISIGPFGDWSITGNVSGITGIYILFHMTLA